MRYFAEEGIKNHPGHHWIRKLAPDYIDDYQNFRKETMHREKECVIFARKRGAWLKPFHCYHQNPEYEFYSLDLAEGCHFDCVYCYLQTYLNHGAVVIFLEDEALWQELESLHDRKSRLWISTGLLSDSLLSENHYPVLSKIVPRLPPNSILEVRSKSDDIDCLARASLDRSRLVVSWSLNPAHIAEQYEYGAATLAHRLSAATRASALGFRIGFHLDPIFFFDGWESAYENLFRAFEKFRTEQLAFLSIGLFRYMPELGNMIRSRFPFHSILSGEFFLDRDGKYHYFRSIRKEMYRTLEGLLQPWKDSVPVLWSMEPDDRLLSRGRGV